MSLILVLPAIILVILVFVFPLIRYAWLSFHAVSVSTGLVMVPNFGANWSRLIEDQRFWQDLMQTTRFTAFSVTLEIILAIAIALLLDQRWNGRGIIRAITILPWALPTTIMALGWRWIFNTPYGPIEQLTQLFGIEYLNLLSIPKYTWITTVIADVWKTTPFVALIILAGLQSIPNDLYEAFRLEGGNSLQALKKITLPLIQPYILIALLFRVAQAFGVFDLIQVMTGGGPATSTESLALYSYLNAMRFLDFGYSATIMLASFLLLMIISITSYILLKRLRLLTVK